MRLPSFFYAQFQICIIIYIKLYNELICFSSFLLNYLNFGSIVIVYYCHYYYCYSFRNTARSDCERNSSRISQWNSQHKRRRTSPSLLLLDSIFSRSKCIVGMVNHTQNWRYNRSPLRCHFFEMLTNIYFTLYVYIYHIYTYN